MITLELPFPPSMNTYWRTALVHGRPRTMISKRGRQYRIDLFNAFIATAGIEKYRDPMQGPLECDIELHPPDDRRRDCDNFAKAILDGLEHAGMYENDCQIKLLTIRMMPKKTPGTAVVTIKPQGSDDRGLQHEPLRDTTEQGHAA